MSAYRLLLCGISALVTVTAVLVVGSLMSPHRLADPTAGCERYYLIPAMLICRNVVYLQHGRQLQFMGRTRDLHPMPAPPRK